MANYGIKVSQPGFGVFTANPEELAFSSKYKTLKIHTRGSDTLTDSNRTITIPHGLGYVPFFLVHTQLDPAVATDALVGDRTDYFISPFRLGGAVGIFEAENTHDIIAWADNTNLYVRARENVGKDIYPFLTSSGSEVEQQAFQGDTGYLAGDWYVGNDAPVFNAEDGAVRTQGGVILTNSQSIHTARLNLFIERRTGSSEVKMIVYGADVDNVAAFNSTGAFSNPKTTASIASNSTLNQGNTLGFSVKPIVEEIISRAGWASGNHIAFIMEDNGTAADNDYGESDDQSSFLEIMRSSTLANFKYTIFLNQLE